MYISNNIGFVKLLFTSFVSFMILEDQKVNALFEKNKGVNDWKIENIGLVLDLKFVENSD